MDVTRWQRIEAIFHEVVALPDGPERDARLGTLAGGDAALTIEVRGLLLEDSRLQSDDAAADPHLSLRLGSYAVDRLIARGGMAAVYEAHRADDQFHQRVAVKIMDLRLSDPALVAQFRAERQILAALEHPALTRLLDGGVTALGEPYLVMEYVDGQPIDRYCDERRLDLAARLRLFAEACAGVSFAHRTLVLHRDLKPSNILVTADGHAKIVDFGTATLLQPDRDSTVSRAPLTPAYASPEQLTGQAMGTASDQYSLGLVLYELLTGAVAFGERRSLMASVERAMAGTAPAAAHTTITAAAAETRQISPARLRRQLAGDLGTIVGKALAPDPLARYASVQHLADDLTRWAEGEPILGRAPSFAYRTARFVQRHWMATAIVAALLAGLVGATVVSFQQAAVARRQAAIATTESGKARQLNRFLTQMLSSANPQWSNANAARAGSITVRDVLDGAGQLVASELGASPEVEAEMRRTIGTTYVGLGATDDAERHLVRALELFRAQGDAYGVAITQNSRGLGLVRAGHFTEAEAALREAQAYVRSRGDAADPELRLTVASDLALALTSQRPGHPEALMLMREAIDVADRQGVNRAGTAVVLQNLGLQLTIAGQLDDAETALREALRRMDALPAPPPERNAVLRSLSELMRTVENYPEAERFGAAAVAGAARDFPADNVVQPAYRTTWGRALAGTGQLDRARAVLLDALADFRRFRPDTHTDLAGVRLGLGTVYRMQGQLRESERILRAARAVMLANPRQQSMSAGTAGELGLTLRASGNRSEADALLAESHAGFKALLGDAHPYTRRALARLNGATD
jgi:tetratricopeptide (TPR) repeat protein/predicted Ser/Thr protein kinase